MKSKLIFSILLLLVTFVGHAQRPDFSVLTNELIWNSKEFSIRGIKGFRSMNNGEDFTRLENNKILKYRFEDFSGNAIELVDGKKIIYNNKTLVIEEYDFNSDETKILIATKMESIYRYSYSASYFILDLKSMKLEPLDLKRERQTLAEFSPNGCFVSYISGNNIFIKDMNTGKIQQITKDGFKNQIINGTTDWVYKEEFAYIKAYDWSPDSKHIAFLKFDESQVKEFTMTQYGSLYPGLITWKYPKAGEENSKVRLYIHAIGKRKSKEIELGAYEYIPRIKFSPISSTLLIQTLNRYQNTLQFYKYDANGKSNKADLFYKITDEAYVEIDDNLAFMEDGNSFITTSEKDGFKHIYRIQFNGDIEQITTGSWDVIEIKGYNTKEKAVYFTSSEYGATQKDLFRIDLTKKTKTRLSNKTGHTDANFSQGMQYYIQTWSDANTPPIITLHRSTGEQITVLEDNNKLVDILKPYKLQKKTFLTFRGAEDQLNSWVILPYNFNPEEKYPVYLFVYGGPGSNTVNDRWEGANLLFHELLAQKGYLVVSVDPRGTQYRGSKFLKSTYLQLGKLELEDIVSVANEIKKIDYVDGDRLGIQGWSYGGYMSSLAMTKAAGVFKAGIAVAPVTNWRYYDNIYTERFMRTPQENATGYDQNSPINFCENLEGHYLLIHGSGDDNVHYQNTMEMVNALVAANKQFDMFIYPDRNHGIYGGNTRVHIFNQILEFTLKNL